MNIFFRAFCYFKDGRFAATVDLDPNQKYQFRYLADGENWLKDEEEPK